MNRCSFVSQHWAALAQQVKADLSMHSFIQHQITFLQVRPVWEGQSDQPPFCQAFPSVVAPKLASSSMWAASSLPSYPDS